MITLVCPRPRGALDSPSAIEKTLCRQLDAWLRDQGLGDGASVAEPANAVHRPFPPREPLVTGGIRFELKGGRSSLPALIQQLRSLGAPKNAWMYWHSAGGDLRHEVKVWEEKP